RTLSEQEYLFYTAKQDVAADLETTIAEQEAQMLQGQNKRPEASTPTAPQSPGTTPSEPPNKRQRIEHPPQPQPGPSDKARTSLSPAASLQSTGNDVPPDQGASPSGAEFPPQSPNVVDNPFSLLDNPFGLDLHEEEDEMQEIDDFFKN
ncbi:hypothetical protein, partial [uncultured Tateyamaria sp.]|uniref:hypothetical protein n=1 Tax=uncultured Tateyamaria sp. TaxID=455651 RepID=UPI00261CF31D